MLVGRKTLDFESYAELILRLKRKKGAPDAGLRATKLQLWDDGIKLGSLANSVKFTAGDLSNRRWPVEYRLQCIDRLSSEISKVLPIVARHVDEPAQAKHKQENSKRKSEKARPETEQPSSSSEKKAEQPRSKPEAKAEQPRRVTPEIVREDAAHFLQLLVGQGVTLKDGLTFQSVMELIASEFVQAPPDCRASDGERAVANLERLGVLFPNTKRKRFIAMTAVAMQNVQTTLRKSGSAS